MKNFIFIQIPVLIGIMLIVHSCTEAPDVETSDATDITFSSAKIGGKVLKDGSSTVNDFGLFWGANSEPEINGSNIKGTGSPYDFSSVITGLSPATKYYVMAYASNSDKPGEGSVKSFTTLGVPDTWTKKMSFNSLLWPGNLIAIDENNYWMTLSSIPDRIPNPNLPIHILKSGDGGNTWSDVIIPNSEGKFAAQLAALNSSTAWINIRGLGLFKTSDGGASWTLINQTTDFVTHGMGMHFFSQNEGVAKFIVDNSGIVNDSIVIIKTYNGGTTWNRVQYGSQIAHIDGETSWYAGKGPVEAIGDTVAFPTDCGRIFMSYDRGNTWKAISTGSSPYETTLSLALISSRKFAVLSNGKTDFTGGTYHFVHYQNSKIFATEDGGNTWLPSFQLGIVQGLITSIPGQKNIYMVNGIYYDYNGGSYLSKDSGRSFFSVDSLYTSLAAVGFASIQSGVGATLNSNINPTVPPLNYVYIWSPERLYRKAIIPR